MLNRILLITIILIVCLLPTTAFAYYDVEPNGSHTLIEIFPDEDSPALAREISDKIGGGNEYYIPSSANEFGGITSVDVHEYGIKQIYGLKYCRNLTALSLQDNELDSQSMDAFPDLAKLTTLDMSRNFATSDGLPYLAKLPLATLDLSGNQITGKNIESLPTSLTTLDLSDNKIGDKGVSAISSNLKNITTLNLSNSNVGDDGASSIADGLSNLTLLNLSGNNITDIGAKALAGIKQSSAITLDLRNNSISPNGMKSLIGAGFKSLLLDKQIVTTSAIEYGRAPIVHQVTGEASAVNKTSISDMGVLDVAGATITWPTRKTDTVFSYNFTYQGFDGIVYIPFEYKPFIYTVTFDDNQGNVTEVNVEDENLVTEIADPKWKDHIFIGWSTSKDGDTIFDFGTPITENTVLYGVWDTNVVDSDTQNKSEENKNDLPSNTGDGNNLAIYAVLLIVALAVLGYAIIRKIRINQ